MPFAVHLSTRELSRLSPSAIAKLKIQLHGVAELAELCDESDPIWQQVRTANGQLEFSLDGYCVRYEVDRARRTVTVTEAARSEEPSAPRAAIDLTKVVRAGKR